MIIAVLKSIVNNYDEHLTVIVEMPNGIRRNIGEIVPEIDDNGMACAMIILSRNFKDKNDN
jgi:hypothetical protein